MEADLLELQKALQLHGILINFSGRFTQSVIEELGDAVKRYLEMEPASQNATFNVFSVFIEQTQNIKNYCMQVRDAARREWIANSGIVAIGKAAGSYFVASGNMIENQDAAALAAKLDAIAGLDKAGLKKMYKERLRRRLPPDSQSAGIGFIDMARRASRPLQHSIVKLDDQVSFFTLKVYIS